jgi:hypothetical protein
MAPRTLALLRYQAPIYVMNSAFDAWQLGNNQVGCVSVPSKPCNDSAVQEYGAALKARVAAGLASKTGKWYVGRGER